jgi:outer membrane protein OmpA-like peptidoglycan-associated protein
MKKTVNIILCTLMSIFVLSGCGEKEKNEYVSFVIGANENTYVHNFENANKDLHSFVENGGNISFVVCDGKPTVKSDEDIKKLDSSYSKGRKEKLWKETLNNIYEIADKVRPSCEQIDLLSSIDLAAKNIREKDGEKSIFIFASGICTEGILDMSHSVIDNIDVDKIVNTLKESDIPKLNDINIKFFSLGSVGGNQYLSPTAKNKLQLLWDGILKKCSAKSVDFSDLPSKDKLYDNVPKVNIVESKKVESILVNNDTSIDLSSDNIYKYNEFFFKKNSDILKDENDSLQKSATLTDYLTNKPNIKITLIGTTAKDGSVEGCIELSKKRAQTIANLLITKGVDRSRITIYGLGYNNCFHENEYDSKGNFIEEIAQRNRSCYVMNSNAKILKEIGLY